MPKCFLQDPISDHFNPHCPPGRAPPPPSIRQLVYDLACSFLFSCHIRGGAVNAPLQSFSCWHFGLRAPQLILRSRLNGLAAKAHSCSNAATRGVGEEGSGGNKMVQPPRS